MKYGYYPGCSLEKNARAYHTSALAVAKALGIEFAEVPDWNCCGATEYISIDALPAYALISRNLALAAEQNLNGNGQQLVAPCSACFLNLSKADHYMAESSQLADQVNTALAAGGLHYDPGSVRVRHLLDVVVDDVGYEAVAKQVTKPLYNLRLACYYGCLIVRPDYGGLHDDPEYPVCLDELMQTLGATVVDYPVKTHCCGGHMTQISESTALELIRRLLKSAADYEADAIVTLCPMCQLNLDGYQEAVNKHFGTDYQIPILYFTQLMGLAFGMAPKELGIGKEFVDAKKALAKIQEEAPRKMKRRRPPKEALPMPHLHEEGQK
ncbi:MAG: disulfide reductase [Chloroflexi bacterium]|nr:disulfide reductase [Chloroflexota bacterium]